MKIIIKANFSTDGDYRIDGYEYSSNIRSEDININLRDKNIIVCTKTIQKHPYDDEYVFIKEFKCDNEMRCEMYARSYLEDLLCNIRVGGNHYWLIQDFYEMFDKAIKSIGHEKYFYESISGNYEGTDLEIYTTN